MKDRLVPITAVPHRTKGIPVHASIHHFPNRVARQEQDEELFRLSMVAKETISAVVITDADRKTLWVNDAFTRMTGYLPEEIIGKTPASLLEGPGTDPNTVRKILQAYSNKEPFHVEILNFKKDGTPFWSELHVQPLFNKNGEVYQFFSIRNDITQRKQLEKQLEEERLKTTKAVIAAQERERGIVSQELHDNVNQVLTTVKLYTEICRDGLGNTKEIMDKSIKLLQDSINEIRSLSKRLSAPSIGNINLSESVRELIDAIRATNRFEVFLDTTGIDGLELDHEIHLGIYRILQEHLTNILKHAKASEVKILLDFIDGKISLMVYDNGLGFDPKKKSNGIGITNMKTRAESLNGSLTFDSTPGHGCRLTIVLPIGAM